MEVLFATRSIQSSGGKKPGMWVNLPYVSRRKQVYCPGKDQVGAPLDSAYGSLLWKAELGMEMQLTIDSKEKGLMKVKTSVLGYKPCELKDNHNTLAALFCVPRQQSKLVQTQGLPF